MQYTLNCLTDTKTCIVYNILSYDKNPHEIYNLLFFQEKIKQLHAIYTLLLNWKNMRTNAMYNQTITCNVHYTVL